MKRSLFFSFIFFLIFTSTSCDNSQNSNDVNTHDFIAIINGILIDGNGSDPITNTTIIIQGDRIHLVGSNTSTDIPEGAKIIDIEGAYILPGFMNTHVHNGYDENHLREWARSGVTTVRDVGTIGNTPSLAFSQRNSLNGNRQNARLVAAGPMVTAPGGYGRYPVHSSGDAIAKINLLIESGADIIKIAIEDDLQGRTWPMLPKDTITAIVETSHQKGKPVAAHISRAKHLELAIQCEVDDVNHMIVDHLPDTLITQMVKADIYWVPTLELWHGVSKRYNIDWDVVAKNNLRRFVKAGGKVAIGTDFDGYTTPFDSGMPITEIRLMGESGMTPKQIILSGTKHGAHVCNLENDLGTIETGKIADLIVVSGNPLENLETLSDVQLVIHNGEILLNKLTQ